MVLSSIFLFIAGSASVASVPTSELDIDLRFNGARVYLNLDNSRIIRFDDQLNFRTYEEISTEYGRSTANIRHETGRAQGEVRLNPNRGILEVELNSRWRTPDKNCQLRRVTLPITDLPFSFEDKNSNGCSYSISFSLADW